MVHFLQSKSWQECKKNLGNEVFEVGDYFFHTTKLPFIGKTIGYMPRPDVEQIDWDLLSAKAQEAKSIYVTIDPNNNEKVTMPQNYNFSPGSPIHLQETVVLDLKKDLPTLLSEMKQKHRYNVNLAGKKGVSVEIDDSDEAFEVFIRLYLATAERQKYHGRSESYLRTVWKTLKKNHAVTVATAYYEEHALASWMLFLHDKTLYYPYGGSSDDYKNVMAPYALVWGIIEWGKEKGYESFDLWGIHPAEKTEQQTLEYDGYSRFKVGFGGQIVSYASTFNFIVNPSLYAIIHYIYKVRNKLTFKR